MLIDRATETETLARSLASVAAGTGTAVVIEGPAGTGKSALLDLAEREARDLGWLVRRAAHGPAEQRFPFSVIRTLLEQPLRTAAPETRAAAGPAGALLLDGDVPDTDATTTIAHSLFWVCSALAEQRPLALLIDDAHWADRASLETLAYLARRVHDIPLLIILAVRSHEPTAALDVLAEFGAIQDVAVLEPGALSPAGSAELIRVQMPGASAALCDRCHREAAGNPWLLAELAHQIAARRSSAAALQHAGGIALRHRLGQLTADQRYVARALAIAGDGTEPHRLAEIAGVAAEGLAAARAALVASGLCAHDGWQFVHRLVAQAVRDEMPAADRERLHRAAAGALRGAGASAATAATHLLQCGPASDPGATAVLREAGADAAAHGAHDVAVVYLERALLERAPGDDRAAMLSALSAAAFHAGLPDSRQRLWEAVAEGPDGRTRVEILARLAALEVIDPQDGTLDEVLGAAAASELDPESELALELELAGLDALLMHPERHEERAQRLGAIDPGAIEHSVLRATARAHQAWRGTETGLWDAAACAALARAAIADDVLLDRSAEHAGFHMAVRVLTLTDHVDESESAIARLRETALRRGSVPLSAAVEWHAAALALRVGRIADAERQARAALDLVGDGTLVSAASVEVLAEALIERGELSEAHEILAARLAPGGARAGHHDAGLRHARARLWLAEGDYEAAEADAREVGRLRLAHGRRNPAWTPWRATLALALAHQGRCEEAVAVADEDVELAGAFGAPTALARALDARCVSEAEVERRAALAAAAVSDFDGPATLVLAGLQVELGSALVRLGQRIEARDVLRSAFATADAAGAAPLADRIRRKLVASGARPRRSATEGAAALTPRQRQICDLAVAGKSNRAIAHALFLSVKTVETHLTRAYGTLGVLDRAGLVATLAGSPAPPVSEPNRRPASWVRERMPSFA